MAQFVTWQTAEAKRRVGKTGLGGVKVIRSELFGPSKFSYAMAIDERMQLYEELLKQQEAPQAFLVETPANSETPAHFHRVPQYQVFVHGSGKLGRKHDLETVTFHYTDEFTGYGPILPGNDGLSYFTLRSFFDPCGEEIHQPGVREKLRPSARRHLVVGPDKIYVSRTESLATRRDIVLDYVIEPHDDGLAAYVMRAGSGLKVTGPDPSAGGGQYWLVLCGTLLHQGSEYVRHSLIWVSRSEPPLAVTAADGGVEIAVLQFPRAFTSRTTHAKAA